MKIIVIGASGTIGREVCTLLGQNHEILDVGHTNGSYKVDLSSKKSIKDLFEKTGKADAIICAAGVATFGALDSLMDDDFQVGINNKLMGQINVVRIGHNYLNKGGSITLTSGELARTPIRGGACMSMINAGLQGFTRAAAFELQKDNIRVNVVSPIHVRETLKAQGLDSSKGMPAAQVAIAYKESVEGQRNGEVLDVRNFA